MGNRKNEKTTEPQQMQWGEELKLWQIRKNGNQLQLQPGTKLKRRICSHLQDECQQQSKTERRRKTIKHTQKEFVRLILKRYTAGKRNANTGFANQKPQNSTHLNKIQTTSTIRHALRSQSQLKHCLPLRYHPQQSYRRRKHLRKQSPRLHVDIHTHRNSNHLPSHASSP